MTTQQPDLIENDSDDNCEEKFKAKGIWIFVGIDMAIFSLFFLVFLVERHATPQVFEQSQQLLNETLGFSNTIILITSSWLLVKSLHMLNEYADVLRARRYLVASMLFGLLFVFVKLYEYQEKFSVGISIVDNTFFTFYFLLTFVHFCHVIGGLIALSIMYKALGRVQTAKKELSNTVSMMESVGIYWHMVDLLWVYLFLLLYLLR